MNTASETLEIELPIEYPKPILTMIRVGIVLFSIGLCGGISGLPLQFTPIPELIMWIIGLIGSGLVWIGSMKAIIYEAIKKSQQKKLRVAVHQLYLGLAGMISVTIGMFWPFVIEKPFLKYFGMALLAEGVILLVATIVWQIKTRWESDQFR